jgi:hypothetical protein
MAAGNDHEELRAEARLSSATVLSELNSALADLGVLLPYSLGSILSGLLAPAAVLGGFGVSYLATSLIYRLPIAVQPMKAIGASSCDGGT